jgi:hypothetical protein
MGSKKHENIYYGLNHNFWVLPIFSLQSNFATEKIQTIAASNEKKRFGKSQKEFFSGHVACRCLGR